MTDNDYVRSYGKPVMMGHNMFFGSTSYYVHTNGAANFSTVSSSAANIATLNATNVNVTNNLRANHFDLQTVAQLGGSFYVSPTVKFPNSGTTLTVAKSGSTLTLTITDSSITSTTMAGVVWAANSHVKVSGTINGVVTGTMDGTVSSINTSSHVLTLSVSGENSASVVAGTYTASQFSDLTVMIYQRRDGSNDYRVGIWMNCYDVANSSSTIRIYGGSDANPNVMLGNLTSAGLGTVNNLTPTGWGLFAQNAFLHGKVVANGGLIGNWTIGTTGMYYNSDAPGSTSITMIPGGTAASTTSIGGSSGSKQWIFTGKNLFGIDTDGKLYASSAEISGKITANTGHIGGTSGWTIASQLLSSGTIGADNSMFLGTKNLGSNTTIANRSGSDWRFTVGSSFGVTNTGALYATSVAIKGSIKSGSSISGSSISGTTITGGNISIGNGKFVVDKNGVLTSNDASIKGTISSVGTGWGNPTVTLNNGDVEFTNDNASDKAYINTYVNTVGTVSNVGLQISAKSRIKIGDPFAKPGLYVFGELTCSGGKPRLVETKNYGARKLYAYETPTPYFGDIGTGITDSAGIAIISIDDIFNETVNTNVEYCVFLQKEGSGDLWIDKKDYTFFIVKGTPNLMFSWELKVVQRDYEQYRLNDDDIDLFIGFREDDAKLSMGKDLDSYDSEQLFDDSELDEDIPF